MASAMWDFENCSVLVYTEDGGFVAEGMVVEHDRNDMSVVISHPLSDIRQGVRVNLLIIHSGGASEFLGTARKTVGSTREITLFNHRHRTGRTSTRHQVNTPAMVRHLLVNGEMQPLAEPIEVLVVNISTTGALLKCKEGSFSVGMVMEISLKIGDNDTILYGTVVRDNPCADGNCDYGCQFIA